MKAIDKFEAEGVTMVESENISDRDAKVGTLTDVIVKMANEMIKNGTHGDSLAVPQILVLTPDTQVVVDVCKELKNKFAEPTKEGLEVKI